MAYIPQRDPTEVIGRRISAFVIDTLLVSGVSVALFAGLKSNSYTGAPSNACQRLRDAGISDPCVQLGSRVYTWTGGRFALAIALGVLAGLVNQVLLQGITGASVGKMMLGLRVVDAGGQVCGVGRAIVRWLFLVVDQFFCFLVGLIVVLVTHPHRRVGDMVAGTYVVSTADAGRPVVPQAAMPPYAYAGQGGWTPPAPGASAWGAPPPPQPTWDTQPRAWGTEPPPSPAPYQQPPSPPTSPPSPSAAPPPLIRAHHRPRRHRPRRPRRPRPQRRPPRAVRPRPHPKSPSAEPNRGGTRRSATTPSPTRSSASVADGAARGRLGAGVVFDGLPENPSAMSETLTSSSLPSPFTPSSIIT